MNVIETIYDYSCYVLEFAAFSGASAAMIAVVVLAINLLCRRWLTASQMGFLWALVLLRLVIPIAPSSPVSFQNLFVVNEAEVVSDYHQSNPNSKLGSAKYTYADPYSGESKTVVRNGAEIREWTPTEQIVHETSFFETCLDTFITFSPLIWFVGAMFVLGWTFFVQWRFTRQVKRTPDCDDERLIQLWQECCQQVNVKRVIPITMFDGVSQPAVMGLFRPRLLLPSSVVDLSDEQLRMIMLHELAHVKRWDIAVNWLLVGLRALHWWNPIYWLAASRFHHLREQSRDAMVLCWMQAESSRDYSELLLELATQPVSGSRWRVMLPASLLGFVSAVFRKRSISNRLHALRTATTKRHWLQTVVCVGLILVVATAGLTDAQTSKSEDNATDYLKQFGNMNFRIGIKKSKKDEPSVVMTYDISKVLTKIAGKKQNRKNALIEIKSLVQMILQQSQQTNSSIASNDEATQGNPTCQSVTKNGVDYLVVNATKPVHNELAISLEAWRTSGLNQVKLECRVITSTKSLAIPHAEEIVWGVSDSNQSTGELPTLLAKLNLHQATQFIENAQQDERSLISFLPKVTIFNGQKITIEDSVHRPFVVGLQKMKSGKMEPMISILSDGKQISVRPVLSADLKTIQLTGEFEMSNIVDVNTATTNLGGKDYSIQIPQVQKHRVHISKEMTDQQSLLINCYSSDKRKLHVYLLLSLHVIKEEPRTLGAP